jgi:hypothetical protein
MKSRKIACGTVGAATGLFVSLVSMTPAAAYWQFIERPPGFEVKPSPRYSSQKDCEAALKKAEASLKKAYPNRYPLVGSCEEYR